MRVRNSPASDLERTWDRVLERVAERVSMEDLHQLIRPLRPTAVTPAQFQLEAPNRLVLHCINDRYLPAIHASVAAVLGPRQVVIQLPLRSQGELFPDTGRRRAERRARPLHGTLNPKYTFANFVVGASNQFAHAASKAVASQPGGHYNPLFIHGLEERLRNRFEWGLIADIQPPDVETRIAIIEKKAEMEGIPLPNEVALFLGSELASNVRELEGSLTRLGAHASLARRPITVEFAREVLQTVLKPRVPSVSFDAIVDAVCTHFSLRPIDLRSKRRSRNVVVPRQLAMYLCRRLMSASFPHIGELFGRDHSTVIHATAVTERRIKEDAAFQATLERLERSLREH